MPQEVRPEEEDGDARRTALSIERTQLAWFRTGLAALAVAVGVGRIVPDLSGSDTTWPYAVIGIGFALYGVALFWRGTTRARDAGEPEAGLLTGSGMDIAIAAAGPLLGLVIVVLLVVSL
jgi:uncharacterized membrane protein YidH (DUF202 family)